MSAEGDRATAPPLFVPASVLDLVGGQPALVARLCEVFLEELPGNLDRLRGDLQSEDAEALVLHAHSLKGAAGVICAVRLSELCAELEHAGRDGRCPSGTLDRLEAIARETEAAMQVWLDQA